MKVKYCGATMSTYFVIVVCNILKLCSGGFYGEHSIFNHRHAPPAHFLGPRGAKGGHHFELQPRVCSGKVITLKHHTQQCITQVTHDNPGYHDQYFHIGLKEAKSHFGIFLYNPSQLQKNHLRL